MISTDDNGRFEFARFDHCIEGKTQAVAITEADGRLQLQAFAGGSGESASGARRTSLSRALAVRSFLIEAGVRSTRVDVRALGTAADSGPPERVDVLYVVR